MSIELNQDYKPPTYFTADHAQSMLLRDYFAAKAMQGLLADSNLRGDADEFAIKAYRVADAMLKARVK